MRSKFHDFDLDKNLEKNGIITYNNPQNSKINNSELISFEAKKIAVKILSRLIKAASRFNQLIVGLLKKIKRPFLFVGNIFFRLVVLNLFDQYLKIKNKFAKKTSNRKERLILLLTNRHLVHLVIVVITLGVATSNLLAYETKENYGKNATIYRITGTENLAESQDVVGPTAEEPAVTSYLSNGVKVATGTYSESQEQEDTLYEQQNQRELATTLGGNTLMKPELVSTEEAKTTRTSVKEYIVSNGDTIGSIADQFNLTTNTILWANNLSLTSLIKPGQKLMIPPTSGVLHTIKKGDTLSSIAKKYDASESRIREFNKLASDELALGETIMVPGGRIVSATGTKTATARSAGVSAPPTSTAPTTSGGSGSMYWPNGCRRISQYYKGWLHTGLDIACPTGTSIRAAESGKVTRVQYLKTGYGYNVIIDHGGGKQTLYAHLSKIYVSVGTTVERGQVIAAEGSTGRSTGPHLHFEVRINGSTVNPLNYIR